MRIFSGIEESFRSSLGLPKLIRRCPEIRNPSRYCLWCKKKSDSIKDDTAQAKSAAILDPCRERLASSVRDHSTARYGPSARKRATAFATEANRMSSPPYRAPPSKRRGTVQDRHCRVSTARSQLWTRLIGQIFGSAVHTAALATVQQALKDRRASRAVSIFDVG